MNIEAMLACIWAMKVETHRAHIEILSDYDDLYCYNAILWLKCYWERNTKTDLYLTVLKGDADLEVLRSQIKENAPYLRRIIAAWKEQRLAKQRLQQSRQS